MSSLDRKPLYAPNGVVATSQPLASAAGLAILRRGGTAVDAAIAAAVTLTVVQPGSNDIGGDLFAIVWDGSHLRGLNASGRSPAVLTPEHGMTEHGWLPVTVPGAPAGWRDLHAAYGRLPFEALFEDAVAYADRGWPVSPMVAYGWARAAAAAPRGDVHDEWHRIYGTPPRPGGTHANPDAARTLARIAATGADDFYTGETAAAIARYAAETGGLLTAADLAAHANEWVTPLGVRYRDHEVWELPPNGQGIAALAALGILDGFEPPVDAHRQIEAMKLGFADALAYVADPGGMPVPAAALIDPGYLAERRGLIGEGAALPRPGDPVRGGTVYLAAADADGLMISLIQSNFVGFGAYVCVPGTGVGLQNRGLGFATDPAHPNAIGGGKRPFHTIIPGFLTRGGAPVGPFGVMGGHMQPQGHVQLISHTVDAGLDPQAALDAPRWRWVSGRRVDVEPELPAATVADLRRRGHEVAVVDDLIGFGYGQAVWRLPDSAGYVAGSEARADGAALGY